jgi:hypothetical protein
MANTQSDLVKEEFIQNYLQYRWLDETRGRLVDRFFILIVAVLVVRLQFRDYLAEYWYLLLSIYLLLIFISVSFAKTIILFRRQQRGHGEYINCLRTAIFADIETMTLPQPEVFRKKTFSEFAHEYKCYHEEGRSVYLTKYIEMAIAVIASLTPFLLWDDSLKVTDCTIWNVLIRIASAILSFVLFVYLLHPWTRYNSPTPIPWEEDPPSLRESFKTLWSLLRHK